jgi:hypothetical protein
MVEICVMPVFQLYWSFLYATLFLSIEYNQHVTIWL